jgi:outer membrane protein OmpA-like peptidoglycan-associated protein
MNFNFRNRVYAVCFASCIILLGSPGYAATPKPAQIAAGQKTKVRGTIASRNGDIINIKQAKTGTRVTVIITDDTKIVRKQCAFKFRRTDMDVTAMLPGLGIEVEGVGNAKGQVDAANITFSPNDFAIEQAEEQQIMANQATAKKAMATANQGVSEAQTAQASANTAQASANQAGSAATAAGALGVMDAASVAEVNKRVPDLGDYKVVAEAGIYYATGQSTLDDAAKADLNKLVQIAQSTTGYMIEIAGYASKTGSNELNQKLTDARAETVADYLRETGNIPMRRILAPAGYGATHRASTASDPQGRALDRRVDVKVLVNKGLNE